MAKKTKKQNIEKFSKVVSEHQSAVRACIRVLGIPDGYVDDVAQETFIIAYKKLDEFDSTRSMRSWLLGIARNLVINERRKTARRFKILNEHLPELMAEHALPILEEFQAKERAHAVKDCVNNLPERNRRVICMKYEEGRTASYIADILERDSSTIRHLIGRIVTGLRKCVETKLGEVAP